MELRIILSDDEKRLIGTEQSVFDESAATSLLFDADTILQRLSERMETLRGQTPGERGALNAVWHEHSILSNLVHDLGRVAGFGIETPAK